jgi:hypothetical protein
MQVKDQQRAAIGLRSQKFGETGELDMSFFDPQMHDLLVL